MHNSPKGHVDSRGASTATSSADASATSSPTALLAAGCTPFDSIRSFDEGDRADYHTANFADMQQRLRHLQQEGLLTGVEVAQLWQYAVSVARVPAAAGIWYDLTLMLWSITLACDYTKMTPQASHCAWGVGGWGWGGQRPGPPGMLGICRTGMHLSPPPHLTARPPTCPPTHPSARLPDTLQDMLRVVRCWATLQQVTNGGFRPERAAVQRLAVFTLPAIGKWGAGGGGWGRG